MGKTWYYSDYWNSLMYSCIYDAKCTWAIVYWYWITQNHALQVPSAKQVGLSRNCTAICRLLIVCKLPHGYHTVPLPFEHFESVNKNKTQIIILSNEIKEIISIPWGKWIYLIVLSKCAIGVIRFHKMGRQLVYINLKTARFFVIGNLV